MSWTGGPAASRGRRRVQIARLLERAAAASERHSCLVPGIVRATCNEFLQNLQKLLRGAMNTWTIWRGSGT